MFKKNFKTKCVLKVVQKQDTSLQVISTRVFFQLKRSTATILKIIIKLLLQLPRNYVNWSLNWKNKHKHEIRLFPNKKYEKFGKIHEEANNLCENVKHFCEIP